MKKSPTRKAISLITKMEEMAGVNDPEFQAFMKVYWQIILNLAFIGIYAFMAGGFILALLAWNLSLMFGWVALAGIVSAGVVWHRWYYSQWPWVLAFD